MLEFVSTDRVPPGCHVETQWQDGCFKDHLFLAGIVFTVLVVWRVGFGFRPVGFGFRPAVGFRFRRFGVEKET